MPATNFAGRSRASVITARLVEVIMAARGVPFTNASGQKGAVKMGLRKPAKLEIKPFTVQDVANRDLADLYTATLTFEHYQNDIPDVLNAYLLTHTEFMQARLKDMAGRWWNFIEEAGTYAVPTGSQLLGGGFEWVVTQKDRSIKYTATVVLTGPEVQFLQTSLGAAATGGAGTTTLPFAASGYSRTGHVRMGVGSILIAGHDVGIIDDTFSLSIKSRAQGKPDHRERPINKYMDIDIKFGIKQSSVTALDAILQTLEATDASVTINLLSGDIVTINSGAALGIATREIGDDDMAEMVEMKGTVVNNSDEATPTSADFGITTPGTVALHLLGYDGTI